jgi:hypothetical protein
MTMWKPKSLATLRRSRRQLIKRFEKLTQLDLFRERDEETKRAISELQQKIADTSLRIERVA